MIQGFFCDLGTLKICVAELINKSYAYAIVCTSKEKPYSH